jgi:hypothetical protein
MAMRNNTPETNDLARGNHVVPTEWAEQLERERDEAREQCRKWLEEWHLTDKARREAKRERDEARAQIAKLCDIAERILLNCETLHPNTVKLHRAELDQLKEVTK